jgi:hypothetical protein
VYFCYEFVLGWWKMAADGRPTYQYIDGTTAAVVTTGAVSLWGIIVEDLDSGTLTVGDGTTTICLLPAAGNYNFHGVVLTSGLKITTSTDGQACVIYSTL